MISGIDEVEQLTRPATCKVCGLTARNKEELEDHVNHAQL
jgi:hypothetical protein